MNGWIQLPGKKGLHITAAELARRQAYVVDDKQRYVTLGGPLVAMTGRAARHPFQPTLAYAHKRPLTAKTPC
jgi:hypothetical protein